jgi:predicted acyltransferase
MTPKPENPPLSERLVSLDALRGFEMFMIAGAQAMTRIVAEYTGWKWLALINAKFEHPVWNGFTFFDLIFPLFMFLTGVSFAFSLNKRIARGESLLGVHGHIIKRGLLLILWGMICNGLLSLNFPNIIYCSVLGRIGLAYMAGAVLALHIRKLSGRLMCCATLLLGYWAAMTLIPYRDSAREIWRRDIPWPATLTECWCQEGCMQPFAIPAGSWRPFPPSSMCSPES